MLAVGELVIHKRFGKDGLGLTVTTFHIPVIHKGHFDRVHAHILHNFTNPSAEDMLYIDNPYTKTRTAYPMSEYNATEGMNMSEFVVHKCNELLTEVSPV